MRTFVAGHNGMVGSAIVRRLEEQYGDHDIITRNRSDLNLIDQAAVRRFMEGERPDVVIVAAAKVGGIHANNSYPADFIYQNLMIQANLIHESFMAGVERLLFLGSSCVYPKLAKQPMGEDALLTGPLEPTNEPYAIAKISGIKLCESYNRHHGVDYRSVMPTNLYGPGDTFHENNSHVVPALLLRFFEAKRDGVDEVVVWGSGKPMREFMHVDDMADASLFVLNLPAPDYEAAVEPMLSHVNIGTGTDVSIAELANLVATVVDFSGSVTFDSSKPDGAPRKLLDTSKLEQFGWSASISLIDGLASTYRWFLEHRASSTSVVG